MVCDGLRVHMIRAHTLRSPRRGMPFLLLPGARAGVFLRVPPGFILVVLAARRAGEMSEEY